MWGAIANLIGLKPDKVLDLAKDGLDGVKSGLDMAWFTDEEKSIASQKLIDTQLKFISMQKDENSIRSRARRILAFGIIGWYLSGLTTVAVVYHFDTVYAEFLFNIVKSVSIPFGLVIGFYFGVHLIRGAKK